MVYVVHTNHEANLSIRFNGVKRVTIFVNQMVQLVFQWDDEKQQAAVM